MSKPMIRIHDTDTNEITDREMTEDEFAVYQAEAEAYANYVNQNKNAKETAQTKLTALGLTADDLKALGL
jgi:hypothetical protein